MDLLLTMALRVAALDATVIPSEASKGRDRMQAQAKAG
jgi:hypothetical protein